MKTIELFTPEELKQMAPDAYARVLAQWAECVAQDEMPWSGEIMDSLKAVVGACGGTLTDWSIGAYGPSSCTVRVDDEDDDGNQKGPKWFLREVLTPLGYVKDGAASFPGLCKLTGVCYDDDFLEAAHKELTQGRTLTQALEGLASDAERMMAADLEQAQDEESMLANWGDSARWTIDGKRV